MQVSEKKYLDQIFRLSSLMSIYLAQKKKQSVTVVDHGKVFDKADHGLLWQNVGQAKKRGKYYVPFKTSMRKPKRVLELKDN